MMLMMMDMDAVKLHGVFLGETHHRSIRDVHSREGPGADVLHELLYVLRSNGRRDFQLQNDRMIHLQIQAPYKHRHGAGQREHVHFSETWDATVIQVDLEHALVEGFGGSRFVLLDYVGA